MKKNTLICLVSLLAACQASPPSTSSTDPTPSVSPSPSAYASPMPSASPSASSGPTPSPTPSGTVTPDPGVTPSPAVVNIPDPETGVQVFAGVVFSNESTPLAGATVTLIPELGYFHPEVIKQSPALPEYKTTTNAQGEYHFEVPSEWNHAVEITVQKEGHITRHKHFLQRSCCGLTLLTPNTLVSPQSFEESQRLFDFGRTHKGVFTTETMVSTVTNDSPVELSGKITTAQGDPVPAVRVELQDLSGQILDHTYTRPTGHYLIPEIPQNSATQVVLYKEGYTLDLNQKLNFTTSALNQDFQMDTISWQGQTLKENGTPLENVKITVSAPHDKHPVNLTLTSQNKGQFSFTAPPHLDLNITATNGVEILKTTFRAKAPGESTQPVLLALRSLRWQGTVKDTLGRPVANAEIWAKSLDATRPFEQKVSTDGEGKYTLEAPLLDAPIELIATHPNFMAKKIRRTESSAGLQQEQHYNFGIEDTSTALIPLDNLTQSLTSLSGVVSHSEGPAQGAVLYIRNSKGFEDTTITGLDGSFLLPSLPAGRDSYTLQVNYNGQKQEKTLPIDTQKRRVTDLNFQF